MLKKKLVLIGGGGHCKACINVIEDTDGYDIVGILDTEDKVGQTILNYSIIGTDNLITELAQNKEIFFMITVGQIKSAAIRKTIFKKLTDSKASLATIVSKNAIISKFAQIGKGTIVFHGAKINADSKIGKNCIINTSAIIEHDSKIGDHTHISTAAVINGTCQIGQEVFVGSNAVVVNNVNIEDKIIIGAGSVVYKSLSSPGIYFGNPIRKI